MRVIDVAVTLPYKVTIGNKLLSKCGEFVSQVKSPCKAVIISDDTVFPLYGDVVSQSLAASGFQVLSFVFPNGENSKNMATVCDMLNFMAENKISRGDLVVALGGGVVGDMAGFASSIYLRGIPFFQIPTTLLAAVDSSVGGKTGVDLPSGKNLAGAFHQPLGVLCDTEVFETLTEDIFKDGLCEVIKYGCIMDKKLFELLETGNVKGHIDSIVGDCIAHKAAVVAEDEFDNGLRQILNFGHTMGHAIEHLSEFSISHGRAVAMGMYLIEKAQENSESEKKTETDTCEIGVWKANGKQREICFNSMEDLISCVEDEIRKGSHANSNCVNSTIISKNSERIKNIMQLYDIDLACPYTGVEIAEVALKDKKVRGGDISLILLDSIGSCRIEKMEVSKLNEFFSFGI